MEQPKETRFQPNETTLILQRFQEVKKLSAAKQPDYQRIEQKLKNIVGDTETLGIDSNGYMISKDGPLEKFKSPLVYQAMSDIVVNLFKSTPNLLSKLAKQDDFCNSRPLLEKQFTHYNFSWDFCNIIDDLYNSGRKPNFQKMRYELEYCEINPSSIINIYKNIPNRPFIPAKEGIARGISSLLDLSYAEMSKEQLKKVFCSCCQNGLADLVQRLFQQEKKDELRNIMLDRQFSTTLGRMSQHEHKKTLDIVLPKYIASRPKESMPMQMWGSALNLVTHDESGSLSQRCSKQMLTTFLHEMIKAMKIRQATQEHPNPSKLFDELILDPVMRQQLEKSSAKKEEKEIMTQLTLLDALAQIYVGSLVTVVHKELLTDIKNMLPDASTWEKFVDLTEKQFDHMHNPAGRKSEQQLAPIKDKLTADLQSMTKESKNEVEETPTTVNTL